MASYDQSMRRIIPSIRLMPLERVSAISESRPYEKMRTTHLTQLSSFYASKLSSIDDMGSRTTASSLPSHFEKYHTDVKHSAVGERHEMYLGGGWSLKKVVPFKGARAG